MVEDNPQDKGSLIQYLRSAAYETVVTDRTDGIVDIVAQVNPKAIVLSADMRGGFTACHRLKKDKALRRIPIILVAGAVGSDVIRKHQMLPTRADQYLSKPVDKEEFRRALVELLPEDFSEGPREIAIGDIPDRTMVAGGLETAVVTYVEEEVSSLKSRFNTKVQALEEQLARERARLDEALRALAEHQREEQEAKRFERLEAAREEGRREAREAAQAQLEGLRLRVAELESALAASRAEAQALQDEVAQNRLLFERLEAGYKESIATLEEEKSAMETSLGALENELFALKEERDALAKAAQEVLVLQEKAARCELLEEELARERVEKQELLGRIEALVTEIEAMKGRMAMLEAAEATTQGLREELEETKSQLAAAEEALAASHKEKEEMREVFRRLKLVLDSRLDQVG